MKQSTPDDLIRFLADQDLDHGVPLTELPVTLLVADLLTAVSGDGLVEIGKRSMELTSSRGEYIDVERWYWRSATARGYKALRPCLQDLAAAGTHVRLTSRGQVEASRLAVAGDRDGEKGRSGQRGTKTKRTRKIDVAITLVVRNPELDDAEIARQTHCSRSYLTKSKEYQKNADMARRAMARQQKQAAYDARTGTRQAVDDTRPEDEVDC